jgi:hypothetical protein
MTQASKLISLIETRQNELQIDDVELAEALGYTHPGVISMIKQGKMKLPINKVASLASALDIEAANVLRLLMSDTSPGLLKEIEAILDPLRLTTTEANLIRHCRELGRGRTGSPIVIDGRTVVALIAS